MRAQFPTLLLLLAAATCCPARAQEADYSHYVSPWKTHWDYSGPRGADHWCELDPAYALCSAGSFLSVRGKRYQLMQFHFHRPSEELVHGRSYDMVLHLMHKAADGELAGVAVLVKLGAANAVIQQLWEHMSKSEGQAAVGALELNPAGMLPRERGYYLYMGSQTAPPCSEGVKWFVLKSPLAMSAAQIEAFARIYPHDVRPVQPLNGRIVQESR
jgi:carbonic anhydrase